MLLFLVRNKLLFVIYAILKLSYKVCSDIRLRAEFVLFNAQSGHLIGQCCLRQHLNHLEF